MLDKLKQYKIGFWIIIGINVIAIGSDMVFYPHLYFPDPAIPKEVCYAETWSWQDYEKCVKGAHESLGLT